jgi:FAD/FMN-containing dehydrogenase
MGGMFGNNSCGSTSITVGSTREHVLEARVVLADATVHDFGARPQDAKKVEGAGSERHQRIHTHLHEVLANANTRTAIREAFPKRTVSRRNTGYALDLLALSSLVRKGRSVLPPG